MKIVINKKFGGFGLSDEAVRYYAELQGIDPMYVETWEILRDDPFLVTTVEALGPAANGAHAKLKIVEIPDGVDWEIMEYDGMESIHEKHRSWA